MGALSPSQQHAQDLLDFLEKRGKELAPLLILTHDYPDPDAIGSAVALSYLAHEGFGIRNKAAYGGIIGRMENRAMIRELKLPIHRLKATDIKMHRRIALVDTQPGFNNNPVPRSRRVAIVIDQHQSDTGGSADCFILDPGCGATCVILAQALLLSGLAMPSSVATALCYGILTDTLNFFRVSRPDIVKAHLHILPHCDMNALARIQNPSQSRHFFTTLSRGIEAARSARKIIVSHLGDIKDPDAVARIADMLLTYDGMRWALCTGRYRGDLRISLRAAHHGSNVSDVLQDIVLKREQAGGHDTTAGGSIRVGLQADVEIWQEAEQALVGRFLKRLRIPQGVMLTPSFKR